MSAVNFADFSPVFFRKPIRSAPVLNYSQIARPMELVPALKKGRELRFVPGLQGSMIPPPNAFGKTPQPMGTATVGANRLKPLAPQGAMVDIKT